MCRCLSTSLQMYQAKNVQVLKEFYTRRSLVPTQMSILMDVLVKSVSVCEREERIVKREEREKTRKTEEKERRKKKEKREDAYEAEDTSNIQNQLITEYRLHLCTNF